MKGVENNTISLFGNLRQKVHTESIDVKIYLIEFQLIYAQRIFILYVLYLKNVKCTILTYNLCCAKDIIKAYEFCYYVWNVIKTWNIFMRENAFMKLMLCSIVFLTELFNFIVLNEHSMRWYAIRIKFYMPQIF